MKDLKGKVAVATGAASGIGRAMAQRWAREGMKVVLADVDNGALLRVEEEMKNDGASVLAVLADVSKAADVEALAAKTLDRFGAVHLVCNNAGVAGGRYTWQCTVADWEWVLGVNLWGVIHGVRVFVPIMLEQGTEGHVVNTASIAGLISGPGLATYKVSKHGVVSLSETLYHELTLTGTKIGVSVLCPEWVDTQIIDSERNRPAELQNDPTIDAMSPEQEAMHEMVRQALKQGMSPTEVAEHVFAAVRDNKFYILTHPALKGAIRTRMEDILEERSPTSLSLLG